MSKDIIYREDAMQVAFLYPFFADALMEEIKSIPSADRPQGEWIIHSNGKMCDCSACNESYDRTFEYVDEWNFCPNCGARMKGADDE